jgi:hypothetical protein
MSWSAASMLLIGIGGAVMAQQPASRPPVVEGDWVRTDTNGSGSFDNLTKTFKRAVLTPEGQSMMAGGGRGGRGGGGRGGPPGAGGPGGRGGVSTDPAEAHVVGQPYVTGGQTCRFGGTPQLGLEYDSEGFHLVMSKTDAVFMQERGAIRHVYLDGRALPTAATRTPTGSGYSIGHIEPDGTLVVDTTDMTAGGVTAGGYRTPESHVIQRYIPSADGQHMTLKFTWADPKIYQTPHEYEYTFDRMEPGSYALETYCDATDPLWGQSIVPPPQQ